MATEEQPIIPEHRHPTFQILGLNMESVAIYIKIGERQYFGGKNTEMPLSFPVLGYHYFSPLESILQMIGELVTYSPDKRRYGVEFYVDGEGERVSIQRHMNAYNLAKALSCNPSDVMNYYKNMVVTTDV